MNPLNTNINTLTPRRPSTPHTHFQSLSSSSRIPLPLPKPRIIRPRPTSLSTSTSSSISTSTVESRYLGIPISPSPRSSRHRISNSTPVSHTLPGPIRTAPPPCSLPNHRNTTQLSIHPISTTLPVAVPENAYKRMTFLGLEQNYLAAKVEVKLENDGLVDMIGGTQTRTSYSLPGHVVLSFLALPTPGRLREITELKVMLEGKSEYWDDFGRYTPLRIWSHTLDLTLPAGPILIPSHDPLRPSSSTLEIAIPFQITLAGHLPPSYTSTNSASHHVKTSYGTKVHATTTWSPTLSHLKPKTTFSNPSLRPETVEKSQSSYSEFTVRRHLLPSAVYAFDQVGERTYNIRLPVDSTSPIDCMIGVPDWVDVYGDEKSFRITLRVKARREGIDMGLVRKAMREDEDEEMGDEEEELGSDVTLAYVKELAMEVQEMETIHSVPTQCYTSTHPLPAQQPTRNSSLHALISPRHPAADPTPSSLANPPAEEIKITTTRSCHRAEDGIARNFLFANKGLSLDDNLKRINVVLPLPSSGVESIQRTGSSMDSPFLRLRQFLKVTIVCRAVGSDNDQVVTLTAPVKFGTSPQTLPTARINKAVKPDEALPAYVQLFHDNGVPKDHLRQLPVYTSSTLMSASAVVAPVLPYVPPVPVVHPAPPKTPTPRYSMLYPSPVRGNACASSSRSSSPSPTPSDRAASPSGSALTNPDEVVGDGKVEVDARGSPQLGVGKNSWFARRRGLARVSRQGI